MNAAASFLILVFLVRFSICAQPALPNRVKLSWDLPARMADVTSLNVVWRSGIAIVNTNAVGFTIDSFALGTNEPVSIRSVNLVGGISDVVEIRLLNILSILEENSGGGWKPVFTNQITRETTSNAMYRVRVQAK